MPVSWTLRRKVGLWVAIILLTAYPGRICAAVQSIQASLRDGTELIVHLPEDAQDEERVYAREVLAAARAAYQEIVSRQGFNRPGYTFTSPNRHFAYDQDRTIDIYIADVENPFTLMQHVQGMEYKAQIFMPADYQEYRKRYNISRPQSEIKASLVHELLHIILYSYNRNMQMPYQGKASLVSKRWDWYNEGLARYFETLVGYREEFLSSGFRKRAGNEIMVYKGGANYLLRYPDQPLEKRKYDFSLFWQYLHQVYGMQKIEQISSKFREIDPLLCSGYQAMQLIAQTLGVSLEKLWQDFSLYVYKVSSIPAQENGLRPVYKSKFFPQEKKTYNSICSFGFDFYELDLDKTDCDSVQINAKNLNCLAAVSSGDSFRLLSFEENRQEEIILKTKELPAKSKLILILSNPSEQITPYLITIN